MGLEVPTLQSFLLYLSASKSLKVPIVEAEALSSCLRSLIDEVRCGGVMAALRCSA
jgi:hypothetical protein